MIIADKIISSVPSKLSTFLIEQRADTLQQIQVIGTAYYKANKDIFAAGTLTQVTIGAVAMNTNITMAKSKPDNTKGHWRGRHGAAIDCPYCKTKHGQLEMCNDNPRIKKYMDKHLKYMQTKMQRYSNNKKCYCCRSIGPVQSQCKCKSQKYTANVGYESDSDTSGTTDCETICAYVAAQDYTVEPNKCQTFRSFNETCELPCVHGIPNIVTNANAAITKDVPLKAYKGLVNGQSVKF